MLNLSEESAWVKNLHFQMNGNLNVNLNRSYHHDLVNRLGVSAFFATWVQLLQYLLEVYISSSVFGSVQKIWFINL